MRFFICLIWGLIATHGVVAQVTVDSSLHFVQSIRYSKPDSALQLLKELRGESLTDMQKGYVNEYTADILWYKGDFTASLEYYQRNEELYREMDSIRLAGHTLADIGYIFMEMKKYSEALEEYQKAFEIGKQFNDENLIYLTTTYKGQLNQSLGAPEKALEAYQEALSSDIKLNNRRNIAIIHNNLASVYLTMKQYEESLKSAERSWETWQQLNDKNGLANYYATTGIALRFLNRLDEAEKNLLLAEKLNVELGKKIFLSDVYLSLVDVYGMRNHLRKVEEYLNKVNEIVVQFPNLSLLENYYKAKSEYFMWVEQPDSAYVYLEKYVAVKDSIMNEKKQEQITLLSAEFDSDKKEYDIKLLKAEHERDQLLIEQRNKQLFFTIGGGSLFLLLTIIAYRSYRQKQQAHLIISEQNEELNQQNEELAAQRDEIERQKHIVMEAHQEMQDSIVYARRIQTAILPPDDFIKSYLPQSFIFYEPKDVVAGDFYWLEPVGDKVLFAVADCTGHGVPGALMSVVCHNAINRAVREFKLVDTGQILDKTREIVMQELSRSNDEMKDGMDITLCALKGNELSFSGANLPLWVVRNEEFIELKGDKQPIGKADRSMPFSVQTITLQKDDHIYLSSDGYGDQFGGADNRKFGVKNLKELLVSIHGQPMEQQQAVLATTIREWISTGSDDQIDDICILGVKV